MRLPRFTIQQLFLAATLVALLLGLFTSAWRVGKLQRIEHVCFSPNGDFLAALYSGGTVRVWRLDKGHPRLIAQAFGDTRYTRAERQSLHFLDDRRLLKLESIDPPYSQYRVTARTHDLISGTTVELMTLDVLLVEQCKVAACGNLLFVAEWPGGGKTIHCYDLDKRQLVRQMSLGSDEITTLALSADGSTLAANDFGRDVHVIDVASGQKLRSFSNSLISLLAISADGSHVATIDRGPPGDKALPKAVLLDVRKADVVEEFPEFDQRYMGWMGFSRDGSRLVAMGFDVGCFDLSTRKLSRRISSEDVIIAHRDWESEFPHPIARFSAVSPDGTMLVTCGGERLVVWNLETGTIQHILRGSSKLIPVATFLCGFALWAAAWGIVGNRLRQRNAATSGAMVDIPETGSQKSSAPLGMKLCWGLMMAGGLVALAIPIAWMFIAGPWLFPTIYFSLLVGVAALSRGAAGETLGLSKTAGLQLANIVALDPVNMVFAAMEYALLRSPAVRDYLRAANG